MLSASRTGACASRPSPSRSTAMNAARRSRPPPRPACARWSICSSRANCPRPASSVRRIAVFPTSWPTVSAVSSSRKLHRRPHNMTDIKTLFSELGLKDPTQAGGDIAVHSPVDGKLLATLKTETSAAIDAKIEAADKAFRAWRVVPAPRRGELIRILGEELRAHKEPLAKLVSLECGKILEEGRGEVQEMIDICDFAVGLSRQLYGLTIATERPDHLMMETWHPLSAIGVITAFNFPVAVWAWNAALALVCGDPVVWKPSEKTPFTALACLGLFEKAAKRFGEAPEGLASVVIGKRDAGEQIAADRRLTLISATGSCAMGRALAPVVAARMGRSLLELGGNNAAIVTPSADIDLTVRGIVFSAVGTAGQRCTSLRRLIVHEDIKATLVERLKAAYKTVPVGNPLEAGRSEERRV